MHGSVLRFERPGDPVGKERLPEERNAITRRVEIEGHKFFVTVGLYPDGRPGEIFIRTAKAGSTTAGFAHVFAESISVALHRGEPLDELCKRYVNTRFEPMGRTDDPNIPTVRSIVDYIFRWLAFKYKIKLDPNEKSLGDN